jgi:hypothetical protein
MDILKTKEIRKFLNILIMFSYKKLNSKNKKIINNKTQTKQDLLFLIHSFEFFCVVNFVHHQN